MVKKPKYTPRKVVYVDVDGVLLIGGAYSNDNVDRVKELHHNGFELVLWSSRGREHAERVAKETEITELFTAILSKPSYIIDDKGWTWTRFVRCI